MGRTAKAYIYAVIAAGACQFAVSLAHWSSPDSLYWVIYLALALIASLIKLRLPGMDGTFSLSFLFLLYGVAHFTLPQTLVAGCIGAVAGSLLNAAKRPSPLQVLFNIANLTISVSGCFLLERAWLPASITQYLPVAVAITAFAYFVVNTALVSGVLSLLQGKRLREVCSQWYMWSLPYYLIGIALVGLFPSPNSSVPGEAWLILFPLVYLVHFFLGLVDGHTAPAPIGAQPNAPLSGSAQMFVTAAVSAGALMLALAAFQWNCPHPVQFVTYLLLAVIASTMKIQLPRVRGTLTPGFVLLLAAIAQMSFSEIAVMASVVGLVQVLWRSTRRPMLAQVLFSPASLALSASFAYVVCRVLLEPWLGHSLVGQLALATLILYGSNSVMVATVLALVDGKSLGTVWQLCYFWSLPYYLVGAAVAGLMTATWRTADWPASLLILPLMGLVFISYRVHVRQATVKSEQVAA